jgi:hypothetical protein
MRQIGKLTNSWVRVLTCTLLLAALTIAARPQAAPDYSGLWKQDNDRCEPKRHGEVSLRIDQNKVDLTVETSISHGTAISRHAIQRYTTDGKVSTSTGADGDEFHTSIVWNGQSLVFSIEEHEDGRIILSKETWTLIENGAVLRRVREPANASSDEGGKQTLLYMSESPKT